MLRKRIGRTLVVYAVMALLLVWPCYQLYEWYGAKQEKSDAVQLLYQVSLFQIELLYGYLNEAGKAKDTEQLNGLKQAAYSAFFTHERLAMALGKTGFGKLESVNELLQWIIRLQIGGARAMKPEETKLLQEAAEKFKPLFDDYGKLMTGSGYVSSQGERLAKDDQALAELISGKQLR